MLCWRAATIAVPILLPMPGAEFEVREEALDAAVTRQYGEAAVMWCQLRREFLYAAELLEERDAQGGGPRNPRRHMLWRAFWAAHQRFFRHMCMASKVAPSPQQLLMLAVCAQCAMA